MSKETTSVKFRFPGFIRKKVRRLLYMRYKPSEIAEETGITVETIYKNYIPGGCPHSKDANGNIWIIGTEFRDWVLLNVSAGKYAVGIGEGEALCSTCKRPVPIQETKRTVSPRSGSTIIHGTCPFCGKKIARITKR